MPAAKPFMKIVTGGMLMPPKVPILPDFDMPAARYPARKAAWSVWNVSSFALSSVMSSPASKSKKSTSTIANF